MSSKFLVKFRNPTHIANVIINPSNSLQFRPIKFYWANIKRKLNKTNKKTKDATQIAQFWPLMLEDQVCGKLWRELKKSIPIFIRKPSKEFFNGAFRNCENVSGYQRDQTLGRKVPKSQSRTILEEGGSLRGRERIDVTRNAPFSYPCKKTPCDGTVNLLIP